MTKIRLSLRRAMLLACLLILALIALFPMRIMMGALDLERAGLSAREVRGSVWSARLIEARFGGAALGDLDARLSLWPLLAGRARLDLRRGGEGGAALSGAITVTRHTIGMDDATMRLPVGTTFAPLPVTSLDLNDVSVRFRGSTCDKAEGLVRAEVSGDAAGLTLPGGLSGAVRCDGGSLLLPLASQSGMERLSLRIDKNGAYTADLIVRASDPAGQRVLQAGGFRLDGDGFKLSVAGTL